MDGSNPTILDKAAALGGGSAVGQPPRSPRRISLSVFTEAVKACDVLLMFVAITAACLVWRWARDAGSWGDVLVSGLVATAVASTCLHRGGIYALSRLSLISEQMPTLAAGLGLGTLAGTACLLLLPGTQRADALCVLAWTGTSAALLSAAHIALARCVGDWTESGRLTRRVAVVGEVWKARDLVGRWRDDRRAGMQVVGIYSDGLAPGGNSLDDLVAESRRERVDTVVLALPLSEPERIERARVALASVIADICVTTDLPIRRASVAAQTQASLGADAVIEVARRPLTEWQEVQKAVFDRVFAALLLVALSPLLGFVALLIKTDSPGPVLFHQPRLGFNNVVFTVFKFRTMQHRMADPLGDLQARRNDPRITRVGRWLRKLSVDELPQLLNVLRGEMSLVGPRPHPLNTKAGDRLFQDVVADYALRHRVKPGITGWAQVNGWRGETRKVEQIEQRVAHDLYYIENWSLAFDLKILLLTVLREIRSDAAF